MALGFSLTISELKESISRNLIAEARDKQRNGGAANCLRDARNGDTLIRYDSGIPRCDVDRLICLQTVEV